MFDIIVACTKHYGIGMKGKMAWKCSEELKLFRQKTEGSILVMGRKTVQNLPLLKKRNIICLTRKDPSQYKMNNDCVYKKSLQEALDFAKKYFPKKKVFVAGGGEIYRECLEKYKDKINRIHLSVMNENYECDTFFHIPNDWVITTENKYEEFTHKILKYVPDGESQYINILKDVLTTGKERDSRNSKTLSKFNKHLSFNLQDGFPLLTTKKMFTRGIIEELLFFIRGDTDSKLLEEKGVNIWKWNSDRKFLDSLGMTERREGVLGQMYGYNWRFFDAEYDEEKAEPKEPGVDQLTNVVNEIKTNPGSRRLLITSLNPRQLPNCVLPPCHSVILQFYVDENNLDMFCYIRSSDLFLGLPFNIASSSMMLTLIAKLCDLQPRMLHITLGDAHIYDTHISVVKRQIERRPYQFPLLEISKDLRQIKDIEEMTTDDFLIHGYLCHPGIKANMVA